LCCRETMARLPDGGKRLEERRERLLVQLKGLAASEQVGCTAQQLWFAGPARPK
jgi:hypothetical protein